MTQMLHKDMQYDPQITAFKKVTEGQGARTLGKVASTFLTQYILQRQKKEEAEKKKERERC